MWRPLGTALLLAATTCAQETATPRWPEDPKQRVRLVREAVNAGSPGIARIASLLDDADVNVRRETVKAIVEIGSQYSLVPLLKALTDSDAEVQIRATDGLVNFYYPGYVKSGLSAVVSRAGELVRAKFRPEADSRVIDSWIEVRPEIINGLGKLLASQSALEVRVNAARALGVLRGRGALTALHEALRSKQTALMFEALQALQKIRDPRSGPAVAFLFRDPEPFIAVAALETAGLVRAPEVFPEVEAAFLRVSEPKTRQAALQAMAYMGEPRGRKYFLANLDDKSELMRAAAAEGLGRLRDPADLPLLALRFDQERKMPARLALAFALVLLGRLELDEFAPLRYLQNTLNSKVWRGVAEGYLEELAREKQVRTALEGVLSTATREEKLSVVRILGVTGDRDSAAALQRLSRDPEPVVMQESVRALRNLNARLP